MESSNRPSEYHLSINFLTQEKDPISHLLKDHNKNFAVISKNHLSIIFFFFFAKKKDRISALRKRQKNNFSLISKHGIRC